ncbi:tRNA (adenine(22)-N(1))-methyltransferase TrmK [Cytobacillus sp. IB215316]|uniref:tRNA (adenine(22)-N(1))-methyltransferase n=1 Tax=Cytobacillus sp. IB215316 TaxID=3097354 RepID=UPI002A0C9F74|nr:tRNA (adenine(22)-N(1))-methyltransferase TrmK [Cytobacillus sp. IB215316]MDX8359561.1 tRNA (adenine(22)-N(1))-methyltransferase TrmK [Cytobacillus sp. IB215316]
MNELKLSKRLEAVAEYIPMGSKLADIGSDHAYLPCYAFLQKKITFAIAGEITEGPFQSANDQVTSCHLNNVIDVRKGDGLSVIERGEVDCITIAGMGGLLIRDILETGKEKLSGVKRLILQPNVGSKHVRQWFILNGWELIAETILEEDEKIYEILIAERGAPYEPYEEDIEKGLLVGPFLVKENNDSFKRKWTNELKHWRMILAKLDHASHSYDNLSKKKELEQKITLVTEALT